MIFYEGFLEWHRKTSVPSQLEAYEGLTPQQRLAVAVSCCERMVPIYYAFVEAESWNGPSYYREMLDKLWQFLADNHWDSNDIQQLIKEVQLIFPDTEDASSDYFGMAMNAVSGLDKTLRCFILPAPEAIAAVMSSITTLIDLYLHCVFSNCQLGIEDREIDDWINHSPLMRHELECQNYDFLRIQENTLTPDLLKSMKQQAQRNAIYPVQ